ncbi:MAG: hypothetical protein ACKO2G_06390 [Verrucomicrobiales bacterium]
MSLELLQRLRSSVLPKHYRSDLSANMPNGYLVFKKGAYVSMTMPFRDVPPGDFGSKAAKSLIRSRLTCFPFFMEKGLFLIYYGDEQSWMPVAKSFTVDKTALRPVILQSIHFIDPNTGTNLNSRTHWGPLKFGFCGGLIADIESMAKDIQKAKAGQQTEP